MRLPPRLSTRWPGFEVQRLGRLSLLAFSITWLTTTWAPLQAAAQVGTLAPRDEAVSNASFFHFRAALLEALVRRDSAFVMRHVAPRIHVSHGGNGGHAAFRARWRPSDPSSSFWPTMARLLGEGGGFPYEPDAYFAPYISAFFPEDLSPYDHVVVNGSRVRVRQAPVLDAAVLAHLTHAIVPVRREDPAPEGWVPVTLQDGRTGYVAAPCTRSPIGQRAVFELRDGSWQLVTFVAGD